MISKYFYIFGCKNFENSIFIKSCDKYSLLMHVSHSLILFVGADDKLRYTFRCIGKSPEKKQVGYTNQNYN